MPSLSELASRLIRSGPVKTVSASPRRIRVVFGNSYIADTRDATYVWEHPFYPQLYIHFKDVKCHDNLKKIDGGEGFSICELSMGSQRTDRIVVFHGDAGKELANFVRFEFKAMDAWYEEDIPILVHPKDPFKRVDVLPSSASIKVALNGVTLAEAVFSMHLFETGLPVRYYLPITSINPRYLRPSAKETKTQCPYKGEAEYFDIDLTGFGGKEEVYSDICWFYSSPNLECAGIKGMACFYNEKVDVWIDGVKEEQPKTHFA